MTLPTIFIDGEAGTTGLDVLRQLEGRQDLKLILLGERRRDLEARREALNTADAVILCLPDDAAKEAVAMIETPRVRVIDASTAHRTAHDWTYGLAELDGGRQAERIRASTRISNPGCYPTGFIALMRPLVGEGLVPAGHPISVNAVSGYSGGGKAMIAAFEDPAAPDATADNFRLYGLKLQHKHVPEMQEHAGLSRPPLFVPSVGRFRQGMLVSVPLHLGALPGRPSPETLHAALTAEYADQPCVSVAPLEESSALAGLEPEALNGTNRMRLFVFGARGGEQALLVAQLDNLGKGASGAAVQNLELALGL
ncbi:N-acetyl-gamma-glutamyl-phosphate reductase [Brevundimonas sp. 2R-24]|uniref:N-acetyl-gamma-glutamyl-phosphate reductase n=1 Tax=Peiella sedimenti TaxID=3061083 RepID=A0ABT8SJL3_9CAUL|nr:N-acetyl-gamma-glutamyl-phosphate reductase [Caulobacteraceae bacterium XZ-24]